MQSARALRSLCLMTCATLLLLSGCVTPPNPPLQLQWTLQKPEDTMDVQNDAVSTILLVTSPSGIGSATITRLCGDWPKETRLQLRCATNHPFRKVEGLRCVAGEKPPVELSTVYYSGGSAEAPLPASVLIGEPDSIRIEWVDYYRQ